MKLSQETSTQLTKNLRDLNQEIRQRHSSMRFCTGQEMKSLGQWLEETKTLVQNLENLSSIIYLHLQILETEYQELSKKMDASKD